MTPLLFSILFALVCVGAFVVGLRFFRMTGPRDGASVEQTRRFGRLLMMAATAMLLFLGVALYRGELGVLR
jgi:hypothetical protein